MALDAMQERIARIALALPQARTLALAGGGAMLAYGLVDRLTKDIDLFTEFDADEAVRVAAALRISLVEQGFLIEPAARRRTRTGSPPSMPPPAARWPSRCSRTVDACAV